MDNTFEKTDQGCNNIFLIDERLCLSDSIGLINSNFLKLSAAANQLIPYANQFNTLYTNFAANSANWNLGASNTAKGKNKYNSYYSTINSLSASWNKPFSVIYPYIHSLNDWNSNTNQYQNIVKNWLTLNHRPLEFVNDQMVYVNVNLYKIDTFNYSFSNSFYESCQVQAPSSRVCCSGAGGQIAGGNAGWLSRLIRIVAGTTNNSCSLVIPHAGCNINFNWKGRGKRCVNPWAECERRIVNNCATGNCTSYNKKTLSVSGTTPNYTDRYTAKCILLKFKKLNNNEWSLIP
jgi:hypothetical protein